MSKRLFDDNPLPMFFLLIFQKQTRIVQLLDRIGKLARQSGEVKKQVMTQRWMAKTFQRAFHFLISRWISDVALTVKKVFCKIVPLRFRNVFGARKLAKGFQKFGAESVVALFPSGEADDAKRIGQLFLAK